MSQVSRSCQETQLCALQSRRPGKTSHRLGNVSYASESTNHNSNWTTHTQNTAGMSQVYPNLESYVYIVIYIESCNVMHIWSLFTSDGSVAISQCSAKASCTSSAPRLLPLEDLFPAKFASNFSKNYMVSFRWTFKSNVSLTFTAYAYGRYHDISRHSAGINDFFSEHTWSFVILSSNVTISTPRLPDFTLPAAWSCWAFCRPSSSACCFLKSFSWWQDDNKTNKQLVIPVSTMVLISTLFKLLSKHSDWIGGLAAVLLVAHHLFLHKQSSTVRTSQSPLRRFGVNMRLGSQNRFCQVPFRSIWPIRPLSDLSPNLQDFPGLLAFHESTISSNKPLQYLPCGHAMLFSLFGIWELNSLKSSEQCSNYENLWIHRWGESFTCGEPQTAKEWINNVGHLMYICSAILRLPSGRFAFWRLCISWFKFF